MKQAPFGFHPHVSGPGWALCQRWPEPGDLL